MPGEVPLRRQKIRHDQARLGAIRLGHAHRHRVASAGIADGKSIAELVDLALHRL